MKYESKEGFNELLSLVAELSSLGSQEIIKAMQEKTKGSKLTEDIFLFNFFNRMIDIAASVVVISKKGIVDTEGDVILQSKAEHFDDAAILARTALEGMYGFEAVKNDGSLADKWYLFTIYDGYRRMLHLKELELPNKNAAKLAAEKWLDDKYTSNGYATAVKRAQSEFSNFDKDGLKWYKRKSLRSLVNSLADGLIQSAKQRNKKDKKELLELARGYKIQYVIAYGDFSRIVHWTPHGIGVALVKVDVRLIPAMTFACLYRISAYVNDKYFLGCNDKLSDIKDRYNQENIKISRNSKAQLKA
jgi:hypothetical protein